MKATAPPLSTETADRLAVHGADQSQSKVLGHVVPGFSAPPAQAWLSIYADLFKARLTLLVLLTTLVGFYMGFRGPMNYLLMLHTLLGTALMAAGASALNQLLEREYDAKMKRTQTRPLPSRLLQPATVLGVGCLSAIVGLVYLAVAVNPITSVVGAVSLVTYLFIYTPLKRISWLNTAAGAVPGALPPVMGWTAATGQLNGPSWTLFVILAFWQIPHFLAIAWLYRDEYARAGFQMLPNVDPSGRRSGSQAVGLTLGLLLVSVCPFLLKMAGPVYLVGALTLGLAFLWFSIRFARSLAMAQARQLFLASILYLPLLLSLLVMDKIK